MIIRLSKENTAGEKNYRLWLTDENYLEGNYPDIFYFGHVDHDYHPIIKHVNKSSNWKMFKNEGNGLYFRTVQTRMGDTPINTARP